MGCSDNSYLAIWKTSVRTSPFEVTRLGTLILRLPNSTALVAA